MRNSKNGGGCRTLLYKGTRVKVFFDRKTPLFFEFIKSLFFFFVTWFFLSRLALFFPQVKDKVDSVYYDFLTQISAKEKNQPLFSFVELTQHDFDLYHDRQILLKKILHRLEGLGASQAYIILNRKEFPYHPSFFEDISLGLKGDFPVFFGFFFLNEKEKRSFRSLSKDHFFDMRTNRLFRREVVRTLSLREKEDSIYYRGARDFITREQGDFFAKNWDSLLSLSENNFFSKPNSLIIKYRKLNDYKSFSLDEFLEGGDFWKKRIIFIGSQIFYPKSPGNPEGSYLNSPWDGELSHPKFSSPLLFVAPIFLENLIESSFLRPLNEEAIFWCSFLCFFLSFFVWFFGRRLLSFICFFLQALVLFFVSLLSFQKSLFLEGFWFLGMSFSGSFLGSFSSEKKQIKIKSLEKDLLSRESKDSNYDNKISVEILKEIENFLIKNRSLLKDFFSDKDDQFDEKVRSLVEEKTAIVSSSVKGLYPYLETLEKNGINEERVNVFLLVEEVLTSFSDLIQEKELSFRVEIDKKKKILTDKVLLKAILYNVIFNAIKYTFKKTLIKISFHLLEGSPVLSVFDQGPGFKGFESSSPTRDKKKSPLKGYGLGLYLSKIIAQKIDLDISFSKDVGFSSVVKITFKKSFL